MTRPSVRADLVDMVGYHSPQVDVTIRLNTNEAPFAPPPEFVAAMKEAVDGIDWHRYPDRSASRLRQALGDLHGIATNQVFCANGSNEVLQTLLLTFAGANRTTLTFEPTYALHSHLSRISGSRPLSMPRGDDFTLDAGEACGAVRSHRPAVTFLCSPNNPTGIVEPKSTIEAVLEAVTEVDGLLVVDEAYGEFAQWSAIAMLGEETPLVVTKTYSKTWSMAAARLGYLFGPSWLVERLEQVVLPYHLDALKQAAGLAALAYVDQMNARVEGIMSERERVSQGLAELGVHVWPSGANFLLFRSKKRGEEVWDGLVRRSILVRNTASWDRLDDCLRVTIGTPSENDAFLSALADVLAE